MHAAFDFFIHSFATTICVDTKSERCESSEVQTHLGNRVAIGTDLAILWNIYMKYRQHEPADTFLAIAKEVVIDYSEQNHSPIAS